MTSNPSKSPPDWASNHWVAALLHALPLQLPLLLLISKKNFQKPHQQPPSLGSQSKVQTHHDPPHSPSPHLPPLPLCSHLPPLLTPSATAPHHHPNPPPPLPFQPPPTSPQARLLHLRYTRRLPPPPPAAPGPLPPQQPVPPPPRPPRNPAREGGAFRLCWVCCSLRRCREC